MPYAQAFARGVVQDALLRELADGKTRIEDIDLDHADTLVRERLTALA